MVGLKYILCLSCKIFSRKEADLHQLSSSLNQNISDVLLPSRGHIKNHMLEFIMLTPLGLRCSSGVILPSSVAIQVMAIPSLCLAMILVAFYVPGQVVKSFVAACPVCARGNTSTWPPAGFLNPCSLHQDVPGLTVLCVLLLDFLHQLVTPPSYLKDLSINQINCRCGGSQPNKWVTHAP